MRLCVSGLVLTPALAAAAAAAASKPRTTGGLLQLSRGCALSARRRQLLLYVVCPMKGWNGQFIAGDVNLL